VLRLVWLLGEDTEVVDMHPGQPTERHRNMRLAVAAVLLDSYTAPAFGLEGMSSCYTPVGRMYNRIAVGTGYTSGQSILYTSRVHRLS